MDALEWKLSGLSIARRCCPAEPVYLLHLAQQPSGPLAVSCSSFTVRLHDRSTLDLLGECSGHRGPLCGLAFAGAPPGLLYSGSLDGSVRGWDPRCVGPAVQTFRSDPSHRLCSVGLSCGLTLLCAGTEQLPDGGSLLLFWDARKAGAPPLGAYSESHSDDVTEVRFHPRHPDRLATASTDGLVNVFDLGRGAEEEALLATCNSGSSVGAVVWGGAALTQLLCLSHDEGLHLWDLQQLDTDRPLALFTAADARSLAGGLDYLAGGQWLPDARKLLVVGGVAGSDGGDLRLMECDGGGIRALGDLRGGHTSTARCFLWDEADGSLTTGGEDGQLLLWKPEEEGKEEKKPGEGKKESMKSQSALRLKSRLHRKFQFERESRKGGRRAASAEADGHDSV